MWISAEPVAILILFLINNLWITCKTYPEISFLREVMISLTDSLLEISC